MSGRREPREPTPAYLSTGEQIIAAVMIVLGLVGVLLPWQLDASGLALWLPVLAGAVIVVLTVVMLARVVRRRSGDPAQKPPPEVSRRRSTIASLALLVGSVAIAIRLFVLD